VRDSFDSLFFSSEITEMCVYPFYNLSTQVRLGEKARERERVSEIGVKKMLSALLLSLFQLPQSLYSILFISHAAISTRYSLLLLLAVRSYVENQFFIAKVNFKKREGDSFSSSHN
jgi:hypothetical protein